MSSDGTKAGWMPLAVIIALAVIAVGGLVLLVNWLLGAFFAILRVAVLAAVIVVVVWLVIAAKARR